jgi:membrane protease YdiL (CAAX protease family)
MDQFNAYREKRKYVRWIFLPCIIAFLLQFAATLFVIQVSVVYTLGTFKGNSFEDYVAYVTTVMENSNFYSSIYMIYTVVGVILLGYFFNKMFMQSKSYSLKGHSSNLGFTIGGVVLFCIGMEYVSIYLLNSVGSAIPEWMAEYEQVLESAGLMGDVSPLMIVYALVLGPVCEELIFRGLTYHSAAKVMPYYWAIIVQAILFGAFHMNHLQSLYAFVLGLGLGYIMYLYDNLIITILIHMAYNIIGTICSEFIPIGGNTPITFFFSVLFALIVTYGGIILLKKGAVIPVKNEEENTDI